MVIDCLYIDDEKQMQSFSQVEILEKTLGHLGQNILH